MNKLELLLKLNTKITYKKEGTIHNIKTIKSLEDKLKKGFTVFFIDKKSGLDNTVNFFSENNKYNVQNKSDTYELDSVINVVNFIAS